MRKTLLLGAALAAATLAPAVARAVPIAISGTGSTGASFTGTFDYDASTTTVTVSLMNTSPASLDGSITGFAFNIPDAADVTNVVFGTSDADFHILGDPSFDNSVNAAPFGSFDIGSGTGPSFEGGNPFNITFGLSGTWTFAFTGTGLSSLTSADFLSTLSEPTGGNTPEDFVVRFQDLNHEPSSDKVPNGGGGVVPEPGTLMLMGLGVASLAARRRVRRP